MRFVRDDSLSIVFGVLFLAALTGQAVAGHRAYNEEQAAHDAVAVSFGDYVASSRFGVEMLENWQSEYLQFSLFILATVWLYQRQRGSPESKPVGSPHDETAASG